MRAEWVDAGLFGGKEEVHAAVGAVEVEAEAVAGGGQVEFGGEFGRTPLFETGTQFAAQTVTCFHNTDLAALRVCRGAFDLGCHSSDFGSGLGIEFTRQGVGDIVVAGQRRTARPMEIGGFLTTRLATVAGHTG